MDQHVETDILLQLDDLADLLLDEPFVFLLGYLALAIATPYLPHLCGLRV